MDRVTSDVEASARIGSIPDLDLPRCQGSPASRAVAISSAARPVAVSTPVNDLKPVEGGLLKADGSTHGSSEESALGHPAIPLRSSGAEDALGTNRSPEAGSVVK